MFQICLVQSFFSPYARALYHFIRCKCKVESWIYTIPCIAAAGIGIPGSPNLIATTAPSGSPVIVTDGAPFDETFHQNVKVPEPSSTTETAV